MSDFSTMRSRLFSVAITWSILSVALMPVIGCQSLMKNRSTNAKKSAMSDKFSCGESLPGRGTGSLRAEE